MGPSNRQEAQTFIDKLRQDNGGLTPEDREFLERERPGVLHTLNNVRRKLGVATRTYVKLVNRHAIFGCLLFPRRPKLMERPQIKPCRAAIHERHSFRIRTYPKRRGQQVRDSE